MRVKTTDSYAWREDLYERVGQLLAENTKSGAIDGACEFTEELADVLSTSKVEVEYRVESAVNVKD